MELYSDFLNNKGRSIHKWRHYFIAYERHFRRFVGLPIVFIEIGSGGGGSSQLWRRYFGPLAKIVTLDIRPECAAFEDDQVKVRIGDQSDPAFLQSIIDEFGNPDIVLDDGSHLMPHVLASFNFLYPKVTRTGVYMVEDLHTAYWEAYGGGLRHPGSFIEFCKHRIDELNGEFTGDPLSLTPFTASTASITFYKSIVAFERGENLTTTDMMTGDPALYA
jgi:cephalosporin hydroxylase